MSYWILPFSYTFNITIDRIEGSFTVLEWHNEALTAVSNELLPAQSKEGCQLRLHLFPSPTGGFLASYENPSILNRFGSLFVLPVKSATKEGVSYWFSFEKVPCGDLR